MVINGLSFNLLKHAKCGKINILTFGMRAILSIMIPLAFVMIRLQDHIECYCRKVDNIRRNQIKNQTNEGEFKMGAITLIFIRYWSFPCKYQLR